MEMDAARLDFHGLMGLKPLVRDYINRNPALDELYEHSCDAAGVISAAKKRSEQFTAAQRNRLATALKNQYQKDLQSITPELQERIEALENARTFTITTGHQLNLAGGPLYFVYKVAATIQMAATMNRQSDAHTFIPVFWLASEDHDLEEIDHFWVNGQKFQWKTSQSGPTGRMRTESLAQQLHEFMMAQGLQYNDAAVLLDRAYSHPTLAAAHRYLVHALFPEAPLLVIDGDDALLKESFLPVFQRELTEPWMMNATRSTVDLLRKHYHVQVNPRPCHLFEIGEGMRERIDHPDAVAQRLLDNPQSISPNAIFRPLYQEWILPNVAYIGGPAEVAYWLQIKPAFDAITLPYPVVFLRPSFHLLDEKWSRKWQKMGLDTSDIIRPMSELEQIWLAHHEAQAIDFSALHRTLEAQFDQIREVMNQTDASFAGALNAQERKQKKGLENLEKRWLRAQKRKHRAELDRLMELHQQLYENGVPLERKNSIWPYFSSYGPGFIQTLVEQANPLNPGVIAIHLNSHRND